MTQLRLAEYSPEYFSNWCEFVEMANNGTIFHRLDFLEYHQERFRDKQHHLMFFKGERLIAVMPMAIFETNGKRIAKSPFGGSYGGIVTENALHYSTCNELSALLIDYLAKKQVNEAFITPLISVYQGLYCDTLLFALLEKGFVISKSDISSTVYLGLDVHFTSRARNMERKAIREGVKIRPNQDSSVFWRLMVMTFEKHGVKPTHSFDEWDYLCKKFPDKFWNDLAYVNDHPVAGIGHVKINKYTDSSFYLCSDPYYQNTQALSHLICEAIRNSKSRGFSWFDFGTSSINMAARENIFKFKESFGATGVFRHELRIVL